MEISKLTIKRSEWGRGCTGGYLKREGGDVKRCCLGFLGNACGYTDEEMSGHGSPFGFILGGGANNQWPSWILEPFEGDLRTSADAGLLMTYNDSKAFDNDASRERQITAIFAANGVEVEFVP